MDQAVYRCGDFELDTANRTTKRGGTACTLEPKVFAVLLQLLMRAGELLTRDELLDAVWGHRFVTPSTLNRVIALARRSLLDDAEKPRLIQTVHGAGYRYVGPIEKLISKPAEARVQFGPLPAARLPARLQTLIGREIELARVEAMLDGGRSLTILGTGGMGKTQCALAYAHASTPRYPDGVWFFDLAPMRRADEWLQALAMALAIAPAAEPELLDKIAASLSDRRALLLLDNCDRLSTEVGALVVQILRGTEQLKVLATSQRRLSYWSERVLPMPPLGLPSIGRPADDEELQQTAAAAAMALLLARVRDVQPAFKLTVANAPAMVRICERLDGMPFALELAAARFAVLSPDQVLDRLEHRFRFLLGAESGRDRRHQNLIALLQWGFALLSTEEQRLLAWLGVFVQGWTVEAVIDLAPAFGTTPESAVDLLTGLADKCLVSVDQSHSPPRYRLLESVREFALGQLASRDDERQARDAHLAYILRMTEAARKDMLGSRMTARIALLTPEHGNLDSASAYAVGTGERPQAALQLAGNLMMYFKAHGAHVLAAQLCGRAEDGMPATRSRERARMLLCRGVTLFYGMKTAAEVPLLEAVSIAREVGDQWTEAYGRGSLALWLIHDGRTEQSHEHVAAVEWLAEACDDDMLRGLAGLAQGWLYLAEDDLENAIAVLRAVHAVGYDFHQHHFIRMYLALSLFRRADYGHAAKEWLEAMRLGSAVGHQCGVAGSVEGCAYIAEKLGHAEQACRFLGASESVRRRAGSPLFDFWVRHNAAARSALIARLGVRSYGAAIDAGARSRPEDVVNEASSLLQQFAAGA